MSAHRADHDAAHDGHRVAGSPERVWQEEDPGADRALQQVHERGEIPANHHIFAVSDYRDLPAY